MNAALPAIEAAPYAKGRAVVRPIRDGSGFKTSAAWLAEALGGKWVHRSHGYQLSPARAEAWRRLVAAEADCTQRVGWRDTTPYRFGLKGDNPVLTLREILALIP